jgi:hypothetical protein
MPAEGTVILHNVHGNTAPHPADKNLPQHRGENHKSHAVFLDDILTCRLNVDPSRALLCCDWLQDPHSSHCRPCCTGTNFSPNTSVFSCQLGSSTHQVHEHFSITQKVKLNSATHTAIPVRTPKHVRDCTTSAHSPPHCTYLVLI